MAPGMGGIAQMSMTARGANELSRPSFRTDIEGLRAVAILLVVLYHAGVPGFSGGYVGVDVFFVLSGYLITQLLVTEAEGSRQIGFARFYARRFRRLMPASAAAVLATLTFSLFVYSPLELKRLVRSAAAVSLYVSNIMFAQDSTNYLAAEPTANPFLHTWSLAVEEQFYFVWPVLLFTLYLFGRRWHGRRVLLAAMVLLVVGSFAVSVKFTSMDQPSAFYLLPTRFWEFAVGGAAALASWKRLGTLLAVRSLAWVGLGLVLSSAVAFGPETRFPGPMALVPVLGTAMLLVAGCSDRTAHLVTSKVLATTPMQWLGGRSYSWYLWHWPLLVFLLEIRPDVGVKSKLAASVAALAISAVSYVWIERSARESLWLRRRSGVSIVGGLGLGAICLLATFAVGRYATYQLQRPDQRRYAAAADDSSGLADAGCELSFTETVPGGHCTFGDTSSDTTVVLLGDSHAGHWFPALEAIARDRGWRLVVHVKSSCPAPDIGPFFLSHIGRTFVECSIWREAVTKRIMTERPALVIMSNASFEATVTGDIQDWKRAVRQTTEKFTSGGIPLAIVADVPHPQFDVPICLSRQQAALITARTCSIELPQAQNTAVSELERAALDNLPSATIVDMTPAICPDNPCLTDRDGMVLFSDAGHMTATFSRHLGAVLGARLGPLLRPI